MSKPSNFVKNHSLLAFEAYCNTLIHNCPLPRFFHISLVYIAHNTTKHKIDRSLSDCMINYYELLN